MLPSLTAAFLLGLLGGSQLPFFPLFLFALFIGAALGFSIVERAGYFDTRCTLLLYISLLSGVVYWSVTTPPPYPHPPSSDFHNGLNATITGRVVTPVQYGVGRQTILIETDTIMMPSRRIRVVWRGADLTLHQGDRIMFQGTLRRPRGVLNPAGFDYAAYIERQGIDLVITVSGPHAITLIEKPLTGRWSFWSQIDQWRATIRPAGSSPHIAATSVGDISWHDHR
jgi:competence protein ComEC